MKKITLLVTSLAMSSLIFGQNPIKNIKGVPAFKTKDVTVSDNSSNNNAPKKNPSSAVVWSDDFSVPANWTMSASAGAGLWTIGTAGPQGAYKIANIQSTTAANGFALFDSDLDCSGNQIADITTANSIDCSVHPAVILVFQQRYRRWYDSTFVYVSHDGTNWDKYVTNESVAVGGYSSATNPTITRINITPTAGGQATVWVRFEFWSPSSLGANAGCGYSWMVDDVSIEDQPANDISLGSVFYGGYSRIPDGQQSPITLGGVVTNAGAAAETNVILGASVNGTLFTGTSAPIASMAVNEIDTMVVATQFTPGGLGNYVFSFGAQQTETDANPGDNIVQHDTIKVTTTTFARDSYKYTGNGLWNGAGTAFEMGNLFTIANTTDAVGISFVLQGSTLAGSEVTVNLYDSSLTNPIATAAASYTVAASDIPTAHVYNPVSVNIPFSAPITLNGGSSYIAVVSFQNNSGADTIVLASGSDIVQFSQSSFIYDTPNATWYTLASTPMVRLELANTTGITEVNKANGIIMLQNQPNPFSETSVINYEINSSENVTLNVFDATGKKIASQNEGVQAAGKHAVTFNGQNLSAGLYYYSLTVGKNTTSVKKMSVIK